MMPFSKKKYKFKIQICHVNHSISFRHPPKKKFTMARNKTESIDFAKGTLRECFPLAPLNVSAFYEREKKSEWNMNE